MQLHKCKNHTLPVNRPDGHNQLFGRCTTVHLQGFKDVTHVHVQGVTLIFQI